MIKLWLDDVRLPPHGWVHVRNIEDAKLALQSGEVEEASLDHDLGLPPVCDDCLLTDVMDDHVDSCSCSCHVPLPTGYDLVVWMASTGLWPSHAIKVHSMNPVGKANMQAVINRYWKSHPG
jgi:hypothetical protein